MAAVTAPDIPKRNITIQLVTPTRGGGGGAFATSETFEVRDGARFLYSFEVPPLATEDALRLRAWLHSLKGSAIHTMLAGPPVEPSAFHETVYLTDDDGDFLADDDGTTLLTDGRDEAWHTQLASGASADGTSLSVVDASGFAVGDVAVLGDPDDAAADHQVCRIVAISSNTLTIEPPLRVAYSAGADLRAGPARAPWRLVGPAPAVPLVPLRSEPLTLTFEEVI